MPCLRTSVAKPTCGHAIAGWQPARGLRARALPRQYQPSASNVPSAPSKGMRPRDDLVWDKEKEISRTYRRSVYDFDYWANHRSTWRYFFHITSMPASRIIRSLLLPVSWVMGVSTIVCINHTLAQQGYISPNLEIPSLDMAPVSLTSFALSLLLVFRTNSSYGRFDEARKFWGLLLNRSRDIVRQAIAFFPVRDPNGNSNEQLKASFGRWMSVCTIALKCHLRPGEDLKGEAGKYLAQDELQLLLSADHKPLLCFQVLTHMIETSGVSGFQAMQMHQNITTFEDVLGGCERLLRTPLPVSYTRHTSRFLIMWLTVVPFSLANKLGWATVPTCFFIALLLLGIEEIGVEIEEPFGILPLEAISGKACADVSELLRRQQTVMDVALGADAKNQRSINEDMYDTDDNRPMTSARR